MISCDKTIVPWSGHLRNEIIMSGCRRKAADKSAPKPQTRFRGAFIKIILRLPELFLIFNYRLGSLMVDVQLISAMRADNDAFRDNLLHRDGDEPLALRAGKSGWSPTGTAGNILQIFKLQFCIQSFFVFHFLTPLQYVLSPRCNCAARESPLQRLRRYSASVIVSVSAGTKKNSVISPFSADVTSANRTVLSSRQLIAITSKS